MSFFDFFKHIFGKDIDTNSTSSTDSTTTLNSPNSPIIPTSKGKKYALCVGINNYGGQNNLKGCVNDANDFADLFKNQYKFDSVKTLLDQDANKANFVANFKDLVLKLNKDDVGVIQNSSHGTSVQDQNNDEPDGRDEAICLINNGKIEFLIDDEIREIINLMNPDAKLVLIFDSCHSGTSSREFIIAMSSDEYIKPRYLPYEDNMENIRINSLPLKKSIFMPEESMKEILLAGCKSDQFSYDAVFGDSCRPNGAFSFYSIKILKENPVITYNDFYAKLSQYLPSERYPQSPQLEGNSITKNMVIFE